MESRGPLFFNSASAFREWLEQYHLTEPEAIVGFHKKASGRPTLTWSESVDEALCFGWIDGQSKSLDVESWIQRFTPRRAKSMWSKRNREHIARLIEEKKMHKSGTAQVDAAKKDGRWDAAYDSPKNMEIPGDFLRELAKDKKAQDFFKTLNRANTYAIAWRLQTAKTPETRKKRLSEPSCCELSFQLM